MTLKLYRRGPTLGTAEVLVSSSSRGLASPKGLGTPTLESPRKQTVVFTAPLGSWEVGDL